MSTVTYCIYCYCYSTTVLPPQYILYVHSQPFHDMYCKRHDGVLSSVWNALADEVIKPTMSDYVHPKRCNTTVPFELT